MVRKIYVGEGGWVLAAVVGMGSCVLRLIIDCWSWRSSFVAARLDRWFLTRRCLFVCEYPTAVRVPANVIHSVAL